VGRIVGILVSFFIVMAIGGNVSSNIYVSSQLSNGIANQQKVVFLTFDDGYKSQYTNAKPILDKYGFKATFSIVCNYVGSGDNRMTWEEIKSLQQQGHDIASHTMNHYDLSKLPSQKVEYEVAQSKQCLLDQGINPKSFAYPFNRGSDNPSVINTVANYYDLARTGTGPLAHLSCSNDCATNKYSIMGWSHDAERKDNAYNDQQMLERFIKVVNSQSKYNIHNEFNAVPILIWHKIDNTLEEYSTSISLFESEMRYLYENGFTVLTMADLVYDDASKYLKISNENEGGGARSPISNNQNFAARVTDVEDNNTLSTKEESDAASEEDVEAEGEDVTAEKDYNTINNWKEETELIPKSQSDFDDNEEQKDKTEDEIPSVILPFLDEP
jgi:peptidoglycan/xylan/chitin deacetylase (PgdA/CDA1 family)